MPKFISLRDVTFFKGIARELVDTVVQDPVVLFKVNLNETKVNLYGESVNKTWHPGVQLFALINKDPETAEYEGFGANTNQNVEFRFDRWMCEEKNTYPQIGDVIYFNGAYYEIDNTTEVQFSGGLPEYSFSIVCSTFMANKANLNIEYRVN
jgi:hypothetical protein